MNELNELVLELEEKLDNCNEIKNLVSIQENIDINNKEDIEKLHKIEVDTNFLILDINKKLKEITNTGDNHACNKW